VESPEKLSLIEAFNTVLDVLRSLGAEVVQHGGFLEYNNGLRTPGSRVVYALEFKTGIEEYSGRLKANPVEIRIVEDLMGSTKGTPLDGNPAQDIAL